MPPITRILIGLILAIFAWEELVGFGHVIERPEANYAVQILDVPRQHGKVWSARSLLTDGEEIQLTCLVDTLASEIPRAGDIVWFKAAIEPPRDTHNPGEMAYGTWLRRQGMSGTAFCFSNHWKLKRYDENLSLKIRFLRLREKLVDNYAQYFDGQQLAVLSAMTLGDKSTISKDTRNRFSYTGASHVLALSGLHLGILVSVYSLLVVGRFRQRWSRGIAVTFGLIGLVGFVMLAGAPTSLLRSATMLGFALVGQVANRKGLSVNNLALAAVVLLLIQPTSLFDVGFQLSFLSVGAILLSQRFTRLPRFLESRLPEKAILLQDVRMKAAREKYYERLKTTDRPQEITLEVPESGGYWKVFPHILLRTLVTTVWAMLMVSLVAQIATLPLVIWYFGVIPVWGMLMSFVVIPLAYVILVFALLFFVVPSLQGACAFVLKIALNLLLASVTFASSLPGGKIEVDLQKAFSKPARLVIYHNPAASRIETPLGGEWKGDMLYFPNGRLVRVDRNFKTLATARHYAVDYLVLSRGAKGDLTDLLQSFTPKTVVLDASLSDYWREKFTKEAETAGVPAYDVKKEGAMLLY